MIKFWPDWIQQAHSTLVPHSHAHTGVLDTLSAPLNWPLEVWVLAALAAGILALGVGLLLKFSNK